MRDKKRRTIAKTISWRLIATLITGIAVYTITGSISISLTSAMWINMVKTIAYYFHERMWEKIKWGRIERVA